MLGEKIEPDIAAVAKERQGKRTDLTSAATAAEVKSLVRRTTDEVAETVGLGSGDTYERYKTALNEARTAVGKEEVRHFTTGCSPGMRGSRRQPPKPKQLFVQLTQETYSLQSDLTRDMERRLT
jgi:hypothetical protein